MAAVARPRFHLFFALALSAFAVVGFARTSSGPLSLMVGRSEWYQPIADGVARFALRFFG